MIEASFAMQYPTKNLFNEDMDWTEFNILLAGIMPETPLGQIITIRSEENDDLLKGFSDQQHQIRNEWRERQTQLINKSMSIEEKEQQMNQVNALFKEAFGIT